jgi:hypothetical protein
MVALLPDKKSSQRPAQFEFVTETLEESSGYISVGRFVLPVTVSWRPPETSGQIGAKVIHWIMS